LLVRLRVGPALVLLLLGQNALLLKVAPVLALLLPLGLALVCRAVKSGAKHIRMSWAFLLKYLSVAPHTVSFFKACRRKMRVNLWLNARDAKLV
jgi:hypothetical protein